MQRTLRASLFQEPIPESDLTALREARASGNADPLALLCLFRCLPNADVERVDIITEAHLARERRAESAAGVAGVEGHRATLDPVDVTVHRGIPVTTVARTVG